MSENNDQYFLARLRDKIISTSSDILNERTVLTEAARIEHLEDLVFSEGTKGIIKAGKALSDLEKGQQEVSLKFDGCVAGDSILITSAGEQSISNIIDNYTTEKTRVLAHNFETNTDEFVPVLLGVKQFGNKDWVEVVLENNKIIKLTSDHEVYTDRGWVEAQNLNENDNIKEPKNIDGKHPL